VAEPTLYLFDGYNLAHTGSFEDPRELVDLLASFVALRGARGIVVFDGSGPERTHGPLEVRYAAHADTLLERLAAENRDRETVCLVSSDSAVRGTSGQQVQKQSSRNFLGDLSSVEHGEVSRYRIGDRVDDETRKRLERLRRGQGSGQ
jgi:predicted RNA-binding protein with PIN domain